MEAQKLSKKVVPKMEAQKLSKKVVPKMEAQKLSKKSGSQNGSPKTFQKKWFPTAKLDRKNIWEEGGVEG